MLWFALSPQLLSDHLRLDKVLALRFSMANLIVAAICITAWRVLINATRGGALERHPFRLKLLFHLSLRSGTCTGVAALAILIRHPERLTFLTILELWAFSFTLFCVSRFLWFAVSLYIAPILYGERRIVIVGTGWRARRLAEQIKLHQLRHYHLVGFVDSNPQFQGAEVLGGIADLETILMEQIVDEVAIALPVKSKYDEIQSAIAACELVGIQSAYSTNFFATEIAKSKSFESESVSSVTLHMVHNDNRLHIKRALDVLGALVGAIIFAPLMVLVALAVKLTSPGPAIFKQPRLGLNKRAFNMYKFRSMVSNAEAQQKSLEHLNEVGGPVFKIANDPRITPVGRLIRKTSIDELPQFFNVLRGEMSLVGPRPLPLRDVSRFAEPWLMRRFSVLPGVTGLWQVNGRSDTTFSSWIKFDLEYIDKWSIWLDLKILARTLPAVLKRDGAV